MKAVIHTPLGATITDVALADLTDDQIDSIRDLLAEHGVLVLPGQHLDDETFARFLARVGPVMFTTGETPVDGRDDLNVISNVGRTTPPTSNFHVDTSYVREPPAYTALRTVEVPSQGGATAFTNQYLALESLPAALRDRIDGRTITHVMTGLELDDDAETSAEHPIVRRHPRTGRPSLYLSTAGRCAAVSGLTDAGADDLVALLLEHSTKPGHTFRHIWREGDVVIWDNACVLHRADHSDVLGDRVLHRGMVAASGHHSAVHSDGETPRLGIPN